jgi:hypothetical protein
VSSTARLLLTCLLAIALPLKALAAVTLVGCGPVHHGPHGAVQPPAAAAAHDHGSAASSDHHAGSAGAPATDAADEPDTTEQAGKHHGTKMANAKCSSCAPCCAAVAPAPEAQRWRGIEPARDGLPAATVRYRGVVGDVPHKPPRPSFA